MRLNLFKIRVPKDKDMNPSSYLCLALILSAGLSGNASTQSTQSTQSGQSNKRITRAASATKPAFSTEPFPDNPSTLLPRYLGHYLLDPFLKLHARKATLKKGEFENTAQYEARMEREGKSPLIGTMTREHLFAFMFVPAKVEYDADREMIIIGVDQTRVYDDTPWDSRSERTALLWRDTEKPLGSYVGSNAFGVKRRIRAYHRNEFYIGIPSTSSLECVCPLPAHQAPLIKARLRLLVVGRIAPPYIGEAKEENEATISDPVQVVTNQYVLYVQPEAFLVYDFQSGKIICGQPDAKAEQSKSLPSSASTVSLSAGSDVSPATATLRPTILYKERAKYTEEARANKVQGTVTLNVEYLADGRIGQVEVVRGLPHGLSESAVTAAKRMRFNPAVKNGVPVSVKDTIDFNFTLY